MKPEILIGVDPGKNNENMAAAIKRLETQGAYKDMSCITIIPCIGDVPVKVVSSWMNVYFPPNQKHIRMWPTGFEVGSAYSECIDMILEHPELSKYRYIATLETDNIVQPDAYCRLLQRMEQNPQYACIGGLYYTKGGSFDGKNWEGSGVPQIWGDINDACLNFRPVPPVAGELVECMGTGMGCNVFRMEMFKDKRIARPFFKTTSSQEEGCYTQDLRFWQEARKYGYRCAIDCATLVGHFDKQTGITW